MIQHIKWNIKPKKNIERNKRRAALLNLQKKIVLSILRQNAKYNDASSKRKVFWFRCKQVVVSFILPSRIHYVLYFSSYMSATARPTRNARVSRLGQHALHVLLQQNLYPRRPRLALPVLRI